MAPDPFPSSFATFFAGGDPRFAPGEVIGLSCMEAAAQFSLSGLVADIIASIDLSALIVNVR